MTDSKPLDADHLAALFDVLTHHQTYHEIEQFKSSDAIKEYGPPFQDTCRPITPILQALVGKFILQLPSLKSIKPDFWKIRIQSIIGDLSDSNLSESYDKGNLGIRKTLATASSALVEYIARGSLGGIAKDAESLKTREYNVNVPEDVIRAWRDWMQQLVYGDMVDELYRTAAETDNLSKHGQLTQCAHEYVVVNLASFMHYALVVAPEGPTIVRMLENVHKLCPYTLMRQTLRIGNVASMLNAVMKIGLAKMSLGSVTNWLGVSSGADEGMNLMQQIMSSVLGWDKRELKRRATKIEKDTTGPDAEIRSALDEWVEQGHDQQLETRRRSREQSMSIVTTILSLSSTSTDMSDAQHSKALEYLALQLSIRDRREIVRVLCQSNPDHLTQAVRDGIEAYTPMIRQVHQAVDLSATLSDFELFLNDMIKLCKVDKSTSTPTSPSVEDFVTLLHHHQGASHRFIHQCVKNGKQVSGWFRDYCKDAASEFRRPENNSSKTSLVDQLGDNFSSLSEPDQASIRTELDAYAEYLTNLHASSNARIKDVIRNQQSDSTATAKRTNSQRHGPGAFLARWQDLLDSTLITPDSPHGPVRKGASKSVKLASAHDVDGAQTIADDNLELSIDEKLIAPDMDKTVELLGPRFRALLLERAR